MASFPQGNTIIKFLSVRASKYFQLTKTQCTFQEQQQLDKLDTAWVEK